MYYEDYKITKKKIRDWDAIVYENKKENIVTIAYAGNGGAIMSSDNYYDAESKFIEAMNLATAVRKALNYIRKGTFLN